MTDFEIENLKVCNVHYNKDHRRHNHNQLSGTICLADQTCLACCKKVKTTKSIPCTQHTLRIVNNTTSIDSAISCCFFSEYCTESSKIIDNENLYETGVKESQISSYVCIKCKDPFVELAKIRRVYEDQQGKIDKLFIHTNDSPSQEISSEKIYNKKEKDIPSKQLTANQFRAQDVLDNVLEATQEEDNLFVGFEKNQSDVIKKYILKRCGYQQQKTFNNLLERFNCCETHCTWTNHKNTFSSSAT